MAAPVLLAAQAVAAPPLPEEIPPALRPWTRWVLHGQEIQELCPALPGEQEEDHSQRKCAWPGQLSLSLDEKGGQFRQPAQVFAKGVFALPGDTEHWPQNISVDGHPAVVLPGADENRSSLSRLKVRGQEVPFPHCEDDRVYLKGEESAVVLPVREDGFRRLLESAGEAGLVQEGPDIPGPEGAPGEGLGDGVFEVLFAVELEQSGQFLQLPVHPDWASSDFLEIEAGIRTQRDEAVLLLRRARSRPINSLSVLPRTPSVRSSIYCRGDHQRTRTVTATTTTMTYCDLNQPVH